MGRDDKPIAELLLNEEQALWLANQLYDLLGLKVSFEHDAKPN